MNLLDLAYAVGAVLLSPVWARKVRGDWGQRFGKITALAPPAPGRARVLLHAVSVGEVNALRELVPMLAERAEVVVSVGTDTGIARARELFGQRHSVVRYPVDFSWSVRRFLDATRPDVVALVELEVWPNFVKSCERRGIPVGVINGRLSERSFKGYRRVRALIGPTFRRLAFAAVQDEAYRARFLAMGTRPDRLSITDTMKWDAAKVEPMPAGAEALALALGIDRARPLIVAGSTGPDEEALMMQACPPGVQLLCAPRKPERFEEAAAAMGPGVTRLSAVRAGGPVERPSAGRFLLDTIGDLRAAFGLADIVVMGRSFGRLYGSDPIEPASLGKPVLIGPRYQDFDSVVRTLQSAGGLEIVPAADLGPRLAALLSNPATCRDMGERGRACVLTHRGATRRHAEVIMEHAKGTKTRET